VPTENVAVVEPADTFQVVGATSTVGALSAIVTVTPPAGAGWVRVILQKVAEFEDSDEAVHCSELTVTVPGAARLMAKDWLTPLSEAVTWAVWLVVKAVAVAENVALVEPAATATEAGTPRLALSEDSPTAAPPEPLSVTVQVVEAEGARAFEPHERLLGTSETGAPGMLMLPPLPPTLTAELSAAAPSVPVTPMATVETPDAGVTDTTATGPLGMEVVFIP